MRCGARLARDFARLVDDRHLAIAGVFGDCAIDDIDDGGAVAVAMPGNDAARLHNELAQPPLAVGDVGGLLREINRWQNSVGYALGLGCNITGLVASTPTLSAGHSPARAALETNAAPSATARTNGCCLVISLAPVSSPPGENAGARRTESAMSAVR